MSLADYIKKHSNRKAGCLNKVWHICGEVIQLLLRFAYIACPRNLYISSLPTLCILCSCVAKLTLR